MVPHKGGIYFDTLMEGVSKKNHDVGASRIPPTQSIYLLYLYMYVLHFYVDLYICI